MASVEARAVQLAGLASSRSGSPLIRALAAEIQRSQAHQVTTLSGWLKAWGRPLALGSTSSGARVAGEVTANDVRELSGTSGSAFDKAWLRLMVRQLHAEVPVSKTAMRDGKNADLRTLARTVVTDGRVLIARMHGLVTDQGD
jgi:uncharacterized protein (DUF305 family)